MSSSWLSCWKSHAVVVAEHRSGTQHPAGRSAPHAATARSRGERHRRDSVRSVGSLVSGRVNRHQQVSSERDGTNSGSSVSDAQSVAVHPLGLCESDLVGGGTRIWAFAHVLPGARIGSDCNVCDGAFVEGGAVIGDRVTVKNHVLVWDRVTVEDDCFLGPNVVFTNDFRPRAEVKRGTEGFLPTTVRRGASIGANATIVCGIEIGSYAFVAAGSVVTRDVPDHALVAGNPARQVGWVCRCGARLDDEGVCGECASSYEQIVRGQGSAA